MKAYRLAFWMHCFALGMIPASLTLDASTAQAQVMREPSTQLGQKITNKTDEVNAITYKVVGGIALFYLAFVVVKFLSGNGREGFQHLLYLILGLTIFAVADQVIGWSQN